MKPGISKHEAKISSLLNFEHKFTTFTNIKLLGLEVTFE